MSVVSYDRFIVARANDAFYRRYEYIRRPGGYALYGSHCGHGYGDELRGDLFRSFVGSFGISSWINP